MLRAWRNKRLQHQRKQAQQGALERQQEEQRAYAYMNRIVQLQTDSKTRKALRRQQHEQLIQAMTAQTIAMQSLADSNKELAGVLTQLIVDTSIPDDTDIDEHAAGLSPARGGYLTK